MAAANLPLPLDIFADDVRSDPYQYYETLRRFGPVVWCEAAQSWIVSRYVDAVATLTNPRVAHWNYSEHSAGNSFEASLSRWLHLLDPRTGSRLRKVVAGVFAPKAIEESRTVLHDFSEDLLNRVPGRLDVIRDFAEPFTLAAAARFIGIPEEDHDSFLKIGQSGGSGLIRALSMPDTVGAAEAGPAASLVELLAKAFEYRQRIPGPDLITGFIRAKQEGDEFEDEDWLPFLALFLFASHENMMNFIGNAVLALVRFPDQLAMLRSNPPMLACAVDELLRYDSPVQFVKVRLLEDIEIGGQLMRRRDSVLVCVGSANRDPEQFSNADALDFTRKKNSHLGFGHGALTCIGSSFARVEGQIAIQSLVHRMEHPVIIDGPHWRRSPFVLRGAESFTLALAGTND